MFSLVSLVIGLAAPQAWRAHCPSSGRRVGRAAVLAAADDAPTAEATAALAYGAALASAWAGESPTMRRELRSADAAVSTPLWECKGEQAYEDALLESVDFFSSYSKPTLSLLSSEQIRPGVARLEWMLSVEWPSIWRARVNILGESELELRSSHPTTLVTAVRESWHQSPQRVFASQVLPRWRDLFSLWNSPTAEHVPLRVMGEREGYTLAGMPPGLAVQAEWLETGDLLLREQAPLPPWFAFTGEVKRTEWYSTVSPGIVERSQTVAELPGGMVQKAQRRRWIMPLPVRYSTAGISELPPLDGPLSDPDSNPDEEGEETPEETPEGIRGQSVEYVRQPGRLLAMRRISGPPSNKAVLGAAQEIAAAAERDGLKVVRQRGRPVVYQMAYDLKVGFNKRRQISMAVWLSVPGLLQRNEVAILIEQPGE